MSVPRPPAAFETETVNSYLRGLWWSVSLMATVGFLDEPPRTAAGAVLSVVLMLGGFVLLASLSAALASLFVREDEEPAELRNEVVVREALGRAAQEIRNDRSGPG